MAISDSEGREVPREEHVKGEEMRTEPGGEEHSGGRWAVREPRGGQRASKLHREPFLF